MITKKHSPTLKKIGGKIREARTRAGLSQEDLGAVFGGKQQAAISAYERGEREFLVSDLPVLCQALNVPVTYFFEDSLPTAEVDNAIMGWVKRLPEPLKKSVLSMVESMAMGPSKSTPPPTKRERTAALFEQLSDTELDQIEERIDEILARRNRSMNASGG